MSDNLEREHKGLLAVQYLEERRAERGTKSRLGRLVKRTLVALGREDRFSVEELLEIGKWDLAKERAQTADDFLALAEHYLDPLGQDKRGIGDQTPAELERAAVVIARRFAQEAGVPQEVIEEVGGK